MQLSKNFALWEFEKSQTASRRNIDNSVVDASVLNNLKDLVENILQPLRDKIDTSININSGYRSPPLNRAVGGSRRSQHMSGQAADIEANGMSNPELARIIRDNFDFDQLILEFYDPALGPRSGWVHVSYKKSGNRKQVLTINKKGTFNELLS